MWIDKEALAEVDMIIKMMPEEDYVKIPEEFKKFLELKKSNKYIPNLNKDIPLYKQNLKEDTKTICSLIYRKYLCTMEEKIKLESMDKERLEQNKKESNKAYNFDEILKEKNNQKFIKQECKNQLVQYKGQNWLKKIFSKIFNWIFKEEKI